MADLKDEEHEYEFKGTTTSQISFACEFWSTGIVNVFIDAFFVDVSGRDWRFRGGQE